MGGSASKGTRWLWEAVGENWTRYLNIVVGDVIYLDDGINQEFAQVARISNSFVVSTHTARKYSAQGFLHLHLTTGVKNPYVTDWIPWRVYKNPYWEAYGCFKCSQDIDSGDNFINVESTQVRLVPTIYAEGQLEDISILPTSDISTYVFGVDDYNWSTDGVLRPWRCENIVVNPSQYAYAFTVDHPPLVPGTFSLWIRKEGRWEFMQDDGLGEFTASSWGTGTIDYENGLVVVTMESSGDPSTHMMVQYQMTSPFTAYYDISIGVGTGTNPTALSFGVGTEILDYGILFYYLDNTGYKWYGADDADDNLIWDSARWFNVGDLTWVNAGYVAAMAIPRGCFYEPFANQFYYTAVSVIYRTVNGSTWILDSNPGMGTIGSLATNGNGAQVASIGIGTSPAYAYRLSLSAPWTVGSLGSNGICNICEYVTGYFIIVRRNGNVFYSTDNGQTMVSGGTIGSGITDFNCSQTDGAGRMMIMSDSGSCFTYDINDGLPTSGNWVSKPAYFLSSGTPNGTAYDAGYDRWWICGNECALSYSPDFGVTWFSQTPIVQSFYAVSDDPFWIGTTGDGRMILTVAHSGNPAKILYTGDGGDTWALATTPAGSKTDQRNFNGKAIWDWETEHMLLTYHGGGVQQYYIDASYFESKTMTGLTDNIIGTYNRETGVGSLTEGIAPVGSIVAEYVPVNKGIKDITIFTNGASDILVNTFRVRARTWDDDFILMEIYDDSGTLVGDGTGTLYNEFGYAFIEFSEVFDPDTLVVDYSFYSIVSTEFEFNYDVIDRTLFPADGYVPGVKTGDTIVIYDSTNPKKSLDFDMATWDLSTWTDTDEGNPGPGSYDFVGNPMVLFEAGTVSDRWAVYIKSVTTPDLLYVADVYQESQGSTPVAQDQEVGVNASGDLTVANPVTAVGYWTLPKAGWSSGWLAGNVLRFNTTANDDMLVVQDVYRDKIVTLQAVNNNYSKETTHVSTAPIFGDMQAAKGVDFDQNTWDTTTWSDVQQGAAAPANYDWTTYPLVMTNAGGITERWGIFFTAVITPDEDYQVDVYSENHGVLLANMRIGPNVAGGGADLAPLNPATLVPYWTMRNDGWGAGWAVNNFVRFNTGGNAKPVWIVRAINARSSNQIDDSCTIQARGDVS